MSLVREIDDPRQNLLAYYRTHRTFPKDDLGAVIPGFGNKGRTWNQWHYSSRGSGYMLEKYTGNGRESVWFILDPTDRAGSGWFIDEDDGKGPVSLGLLDAEQAVFEHANPSALH